ARAGLRRREGKAQVRLRRRIADRVGALDRGGPGGDPFLLRMRCRRRGEHEDEREREAETTHEPPLLLVKTARSDERIYHRYPREPAEVTIRRPKLAHAVLAAQCHDARIMNSRTRYRALNKNGTQHSPVSR